MNETRQFLIRLSYLVVAVFMILTAWGNAAAMFIISIIAMIGLFVFRGRIDGWPTS